VYLLIYPGSGVFAGAFKWSEAGQYEQEMKTAEQKYGPLYEKYRTQSVEAVAANPEALKMGQRLFMTYCTGCHGSDAGGNPGFPNLRDQDWLYGGQPEAIQASIQYGRNGAMPPWGAVLGVDGVHKTSEYVMSLSGRKVNAEAAVAGKEKFQQLCVACHGASGKGNPALGAPNLTDNVWLYGGSQAAIMKSISDGRSGRMPAHGEFLGEAKVHLLAAYIYSLSNKELKAAK
jgi:cytochrome c oxidase cbb3-type subunit 3